MKGIPPKSYFINIAKRRDLRRHRGFTIVELLIVVVVIAVLAAITVVAYNGITNNAKDSALKSTASQIEKNLRLQQVTNPGALLLSSEGVTDRASFLAANGLNGLTDKLCIFSAYFLEDGHDDFMDEEDPACNIYGPDDGEVANYDKTKVYLGVNVWGSPSVSISYFNRAEQLWNTTYIRSADGQESTGELKLACSPFTYDFDSDCRRLMIPL